VISLLRIFCLSLALGSPPAASDRPSASARRSAFEAQYPKTEVSEAALGLESLGASLGLGLTPRENVYLAEREGPRKKERVRFRPTPEAQASFLEIRSIVSQFLDRELESADEQIGAPPPAVERYFAAHENVLSDVVSLLLRERDIRWEMDVSLAATAPIPSLLGNLQLQRLLVTRSLLQERRGERDAALHSLEAAWRLNQVLSSRPELLCHLIVVAAAKLHAGALRKLEAPAHGWAERLRGEKLFAAFLAAFQNQVWLTSPDVQDLTGERGAFGRILRKVAHDFSSRDLCDWTAEKLQESWNRAARDESSEERSIAGISLPNSIDSFLRWRRYSIDAELTALLMDARAERASSRRGAWPSTLAAVGKGVCPKQRWSYRASRDGTATFAFEGKLVEPTSPTLRLPLRFTAGAPKSEAQAKVHVFAQPIPGATLGLVPDAGHFPQVERPDVFSPAVQEVLK